MFGKMKIGQRLTLAFGLLCALPLGTVAIVLCGMGMAGRCRGARIPAGSFVVAATFSVPANVDDAAPLPHPLHDLGATAPTGATAPD